MNKYLKAATSKYDGSGGGISPISTMDAEIVWELIVALGKCGCDDIKDILDNYKFLMDEEVRDLLLAWNIEHPDGEDDSGGKKDIRTFIEFGGGILDTWLIKTVDKEDKYNYPENRMDYRIIVNKGFPESGLGDRVYFYRTPDIRDKEYSKLISLMKKNIDIVRL